MSPVIKTGLHGFLNEQCPEARAVNEQIPCNESTVFEGERLDIPAI